MVTWWASSGLTLAICMLVLSAASCSSNSFSPRRLINATVLPRSWLSYRWNYATLTTTPNLALAWLTLWPTKSTPKADAVGVHVAQLLVRAARNLDGRAELQAAPERVMAPGCRPGLPPAHRPVRVGRHHRRRLDDVA